MAVDISENAVSRRFSLGRQAGFELLWDLSGSDDVDEIKAKLLAVTPGAFEGRAIESIEAEPLGNGIWKGVARYVRLEGDTEYTFDFGGGTTKITQSFGTVNAYGIGGATPPDFKGAIGVSEDRVEGVEITIPSATFTETHTWDDAFMMGGYKAVLFNMIGRMNNAPFKGMASGECLFVGAAGGKRGDEKWSVTYRFAGSKNQTGLQLGDITGIDKLGWDYLWVRYADFVDASAFALVKRPVAVYVERVYEFGDFSQLLIGTL